MRAKGHGYKKAGAGEHREHDVGGSEEKINPSPRGEEEEEEEEEHHSNDDARGL